MTGTILFSLWFCTMVFALLYFAVAGMMWQAYQDRQLLERALLRAELVN